MSGTWVIFAFGSKRWELEVEVPVRVSLANCGLVDYRRTDWPTRLIFAQNVALQSMPPKHHSKCKLSPSKLERSRSSSEIHKGEKERRDPFSGEPNEVQIASDTSRNTFDAGFLHVYQTRGP